jgi:methylmalonyl-CoA/ethylmalonyl-CoA epimerase
MMSPAISKPSAFGTLVQTGFVVSDYEAAVNYWLELGVGPFFEMPHVPLPKQMYRGEPTNVDMSVAIGYSGATQVEIIVQHNDAPSLYRDFIAETGGGLHHLGFLSDDYDAAVVRATSLGQPVVQEWMDVMGGRYAYLARLAQAGAYIEVIEGQKMLKGVFAMIREASESWDGADPRRSFG